MPAADTTWTIAQPLTGRAMPCKDGKILVFECANVELLSYLPPSAIGGAGYSDIWGWTDSATRREFVMVGGNYTSAAGVAFIEVTDPVKPKYLGLLPFRSGQKNYAGIKVYKNHAFITADLSDNGLQVFDLTQLRDVKTTPMEFRETAHYDGFPYAHTIALNEASGFVYLASAPVIGENPWCSGLRIIDVRTPTKPAFAGCSADSTKLHDSQCVLYRGPDKPYRGREICLGASMLPPSMGISIVDVTDKQQPKRISLATYPTARIVHQGWLTEDQRYFFFDDEGDPEAGVGKTRTLVFDLSDLSDPLLVTEFYGTTDATAHNLYIRGRYMYQSNYTAGLRIVDIGDPKNPKEVGYLDTAPNLAGPGQKLGTWGNYPYLKGNVVAVASQGLFLVRLRSR